MPATLAGHDHAPSAGEMETGLEQTLWAVEVAGRHKRFRAPRRRLRMGIVWARRGPEGYSMLIYSYTTSCNRRSRDFPFSTFEVCKR